MPLGSRSQTSLFSRRFISSSSMIKLSLNWNIQVSGDSFDCFWLYIQIKVTRIEPLLYSANHLLITFSYYTEFIFYRLRELSRALHWKKNAKEAQAANRALHWQHNTTQSRMADNLRWWFKGQWTRQDLETGTAGKECRVQPMFQSAEITPQRWESVRGSLTSGWKLTKRQGRRGWMKFTPCTLLQSCIRWEPPLRHGGGSIMLVGLCGSLWERQGKNRLQYNSDAKVTSKTRKSLTSVISDQKRTSKSREPLLESVSSPGFCVGAGHPENISISKDTNGTRLHRTKIPNHVLVH